MGKIRSRMIFEIITIVGILTFAVISLMPATTKRQSVQLDHGRMSYSGAVLKHKFDGQGTLQIQKQGRYVGNFANGRFEGPGEFIAPNGWRLQGDFSKGELNGVVKLRVGNKTYAQKIMEDGKLENAD
ncbi:hypothetical protein [Lactiplantibacillus paraplantarum]|nr:hypothetical protein [Lactiplantibacillus paraplantarum]AVW09760.1 hypothetical protein DA077_04015 [Lactiplantibacillus paraplantarum]RKD26298.1 hypothetical protein BG617_03250 [Lactiplantibacillus paraplantarum]UKB42407.1 hypothetical protein L3503_04560 [Lactiplantibacillus paraplantarum]